MPKPKTKKTFIGFSDISALNKILIEDWNWEVIVAPMLNQMVQGKVSKESENQIFDLISGKTKELKYKLTQLSTGDCRLSTTTTGGCLSVLSTNFATQNQINWQDKILFLEDEGEDGERLDRYFYQIFTIMLEQKKFPKAILLGNFLHANEFGTPKTENIEIAIKRFVQNITDLDLKIPVFAEATNSLGHSKNMAPLMLGKETVIDGGFLIQKI
jgi:muramoyltetrapeptide carboxypeptidase